ncbi:mitochondrial potassium channel-like [Bradysia coprophila]|uniref:mitochondrial potassium channel-like n=1 Tax=Bradysia coprophila TaxID=38358 RepID=UPI00187DA436|nr:mitochondrial potassium channel-like [Bradysia coprophila]
MLKKVYIVHHTHSVSLASFHLKHVHPTNTKFFCTEKREIPKIEKEPPTKVLSKLNVIKNLDFKEYKERSAIVLQNKWTNAYTFYERVFHMDEVRQAHMKVMDLQEKLLEAQENRRMLQSKLSDIKSQLEAVHDDIMNTPRNDRYLELIKRDLQLRATDTDITEKFKWAESFERELFTHLTAAVKLSHEKEQVYATTTKYWSVIASIIGTMLGVLATMLSYHYRNNNYTMLKDTFHSEISVVSNEIGQVKSVIVGEINELNSTLGNEVKQIRLELQNQRNLPATDRKQESWKGYFYRKSVDVYRSIKRSFM